MTEARIIEIAPYRRLHIARFASRCVDTPIEAGDVFNRVMTDDEAFANALKVYGLFRSMRREIETIPPDGPESAA